MPPYGGGEPIPLDVFGDLWYQGVPTMCLDWPDAPTPAAMAEATPDETPSPGVPAVATPPSFTEVISTPSGRIAFFGELGDGPAEVFVVDLPGGTPRQVTHGEWVLDWQSFLAWLPDGRHLLFGTRETEPEDRKIVLLDVETSEGQIVPNIPKDVAVWLSWSPDGSQWLWAAGKILYVADAGNSEPKPIYQGDRDIAEPIWSPDGQQIAFVIANEIYIASPDGSAVEKIIDFASEPPVPSLLSLSSLAWSPDGSRLAFTASYRDEGARLNTVCTLTLAEARPACLAELPVNVWGTLAWLPDSRRLVLQDDGDIYTLDVRSGDLIDVSHNPAVDRIQYVAADQAISPDGQFLAFVSDRDHWRSEVYVLHLLSGKVVARLTADFASQWGVAWSPQ
jgi:Tol biopolymer transport system component